LIKAIVFDFDDTLVQTVANSFEMHAETAKALGLRVPLCEEFYSHWGKSWGDFLESLWPGIDKNFFQEKFHELHENRFYPAVEGAVEVVSELAKDVSLGIITNRERKWLPRRAKQVGIDLKLFEIISCFDDFGVPKPNIVTFKPFLDGFGKKGISSKEMLYVGDNLVDLELAQKIGVEFVGVLTGITKEEDFVSQGLMERSIIPSVAALPSLLKKGGWLK